MIWILKNVQLTKKKIFCLKVYQSICKICLLSFFFQNISSAKETKKKSRSIRKCKKKKKKRFLHLYTNLEIVKRILIFQSFLKRS